MRFPRSKTAPTTSNPEAAALIRRAEGKCNGCRVNWRLKTGTFKHPAPGGTVECWAVEERQLLRAIAAQRRALPAPEEGPTL